MAEVECCIGSVEEPVSSLQWTGYGRREVAAAVVESGEGNSSMMGAVVAREVVVLNHSIW